MTKLRLYPHRVVPDAALIWRGWWHMNGNAKEPLPYLMDGWDYAKEEVIGLTLDLDPNEVLTSTGLVSLDQVEIVVIAECREVLRRFVVRQRMSNNHIGPVDLSLTIPAGEAAHKLDLSAHLVLASTWEPTGFDVPRVKGARLATSQRISVVLEGDASRFPTEAVPFSTLGMEQSPWTVTRTFYDLNDSFMGGVRLFVNTEHPIGRRALDPATASSVKGFLQADILRTLIAEVARSEEEVRQEYIEGSVGDVLDGMCLLFLQRSLEVAVQIHREDPARLERILQSVLEPWAGVF
ncbi:hypothetical protein OH802_00345 [Nocardioides sp. NBC_00850]|uniref:hypothetical protein n=1 Tax=Nocardioides sp. NBC_00850 TaxID=2976001 RepID=UPI00386716E7|nr:hypothetical protein OH802_00345 [Nocardioides sp. NBC_00850]